MKEVISRPIGGDGGKVALAIGGGNVELKLTYPAVKLLAPVKTNFVDRLKKIIPGEWDDKIIDAEWDEAVKLITA